MKFTFVKSALRSVWSTISRFLAIFAIVALGVGFLAGLLASPADMRASAEQYYDQTDLYDIKVVSTQGLTAQDLQLVQKMQGVEKIVAAKDVDLVVQTAAGEQQTLRLHTFCQQDGINTPVLLQGRMPQTAGEVLLLQTKSLAQGGVGLGDALAVQDTKDGALPASLTIVGVAKSAMYLSLEPERTNVGSGSVDLFCITLPQTVNTDYYTAFYLTVQGAKALDSFSPAYQEALQPVLQQLEAVSGARAQLRFNEILHTAQTEWQNGMDEYQAAKQDAEAELDAAQQELDSAKAKLDSAKRQLESGKKELQQNQQDYQTALQDGRKQLADGWAEIEKGETELADGIAQLAAAKTQLENAKKQIDDGTAQLAAQRENLAQLRTGATLLDILAVLLQPDYTDDPALNQLQQLQQKTELVLQKIDEVLAGEWGEGYPEITGQLKQQLATARQSVVELQQGLALLLQNGFTSLDGLEQTLNEQQAALGQGLADWQQGSQTLAEKEAELQQGQAQLATGRAQLAAGEKALQEGSVLAEDGFSSAEAQLEQGEKDYQEGLKQYQEGAAEFAAEKQKALQQLADAQTKLDDAKQEIRELVVGEWYLQDRTQNTSFASYNANADKIASIARVFPVFFFLVAALVALTTMTRMVDEERLQIGAFKALGYSGRAIAAKYLLYALVAGSLGSVVGSLLGMQLLPYIIVSAYNIMYDVPTVLTPFQHGYGLLAALAAIGCTLAATYSACRAALKERPASLLQPKAPQAGKRILLERITPLWSGMKFTYKVTARNLFLYKKRFFMTVVGIAGCTALLVTGFGVKDSISDIVRLQYSEINRYQLIVALEDEQALQNEQLQKILADGRIAATLPTMQNAAAVVPAQGRPQDDVTIVVPSNAQLLNEYIAFRTRVGGKEIAFTGDSVLISEQLATRQKLKIGDTLVLENQNGKRGEVTVGGIVENYVGHMVYLSANGYHRVFGERPVFDTLLCKLQATQGEAARAALSTDLLAAKGVLGSVHTAELSTTFDTTIQSLNGIVLVLIVAAGLLAFVVLYNLININIAERSKEIATIKVLGFFDREVAAYIFRETTALTVIGTLAGLLFGSSLHQFVMRAAEMSNVMFGRSIAPLSYLYSFLLTLLFGGIVSVVMNKKLIAIDMVESLKAPE